MLLAVASLCAVALAAAPAAPDDADAREYAGPEDVAPPEVPGDTTSGAPGQLKEAPASRTEISPTATKVPTKKANSDETREVVVKPRNPQPSERDRATSVIGREELDERLPRSAPDALRGLPGVYIQQTAHGQASPYLRGLTGQQTIMVFDGVRLNTTTYRQGPNQYFFTIDSRTIDHLEVVRGSASTRWGSDAMGGAIIAYPIEPVLDKTKRVAVHPQGSFRTTTADAEIGGRAQTSISLNGKLGLQIGVGYRDVDLLRTGGRVIEPETGKPQTVPPLYGPDGKTQLGTGFRELTDNARFVWQQSRKQRFTIAYDDYRQFDAPRTDKCPPRTAPQDECLTYLQQFRMLTYGLYELQHGPAAAEKVRLTLSYQRQHEQRREHRGSPSATEITGRDDVHSAGTGLKIDTREFELAPWATLGVRYGADAYNDTVKSDERLTFTDVDISVDRPRGQYLDNGNYLTSGTWAEVHTEFADAVRLKAGGRGAFVNAHARGNEETSSEPVDRRFAAVVGNAGIAADAVDWLTFLFNADQGFRAPNLDDLTSRQQVGPGYQYENANLIPERSLSLEAGSIAKHPWFEFQAFAYRTALRHAIQRTSRELEDCLPGDATCMESRSRFQLVNLDGPSFVWGAEGGATIYLPVGFGLRGTISYAWGDGPNPHAGEPFQPSRVPLSRIPPLNGVGELGWRKWGLWIVGAVRWAGDQTRLAPQDRVDSRIPRGGTPGYVVFDIRAGYRLDPYVLLSMVFENLADTPYRHHGSSVNGPGRGVIMHVQFGF